MTLSRWRRLATGIAAGVLVLGAAILGASFRSESNPVSVASDLRPTDVIAIPEDDDEVVAVDADGDDEVSDAEVSDDEVSDAESSDTEADSVQVIEVDDLPEDDAADEPELADSTDPDSTDSDTADADSTDSDTADTDSTDPDTADTDSTDPDSTDPDTADQDTADTDSTDSDTADTDSAPEAPTEDSAPQEDSTEDDAAQEQAPAAEPPAPPPTPAPTPPPPSNGEALGTGGGVNDAECGLDRLVIYAGAPVGGVAGRLRAALAQNGFGAGCAQPVTVLASNCPQQFSGVLREPGYDPSRPYVAASANVDRDTMTSIVGSTGYTGSTIDILNFGFVNPDRPGEQWVAIFVPPSFSGWEGLASQAGLAPSSGSLCGPSGELGR